MSNEERAKAIKLRQKYKELISDAGINFLNDCEEAGIGAHVAMGELVSETLMYTGVVIASAVENVPKEARATGIEMATKDIRTKALLELERMANAKNLH